MSSNNLVKTIQGRLKRTHNQALGGSSTQGGTSPPRIRNRSSSPAVNPASPVGPSAGGPSTHQALGATVSNSIASPADISKTQTRTRHLKSILGTGSKLFGPLGTVIDDLASCFEMHEDAVSARQEYASLADELSVLLSTLSTQSSDNVPFTITASVDNLCHAISKELDNILDKKGRGEGMRHLQAKKDLEEVARCYRRINEHVKRLTEGRLRALAPSMSAYYDSAEAALVRRRECTPETRKKVLADLSDWRYDRQQPSIYWINGMAGTGKTTIAQSFCSMLEKSHELGASFFCTRQLPECRSVKLILPTIAYQLSRFSHPFRCALSRVLERDPDIHAKALVKQFSAMIINPLREVIRALPADLVVVIDALDECEDSNGAGQLLEMIVRNTSELPIKVFVSSRPEPHVRQKIGTSGTQLVLHELEESVVKDDIEIYLRVELERIALSDEQIACLVERSGVLFIYAATVVRYIGQDDFSMNPKKRLKNILDTSNTARSNKYQDIDELYTLILASVLDHPGLESEDRELIELVLHTVICAQQPLTVDALARLLHLDDADEVHTALRPLWSVIHTFRSSGLVSTLHASFPDYMLNSARSSQYWCNPAMHHGRLSEMCFQRIERNERQFNICGLTSSCLLDENVPDLEAQVLRAVPLDLSYACQYWAAHLELGKSSDERMELLRRFLSMRLLLWMEVLNSTKRISSGVSMLEKTRSWCMANKCSPDIMDLVHDAWRFTTVFATNPVSQSTPHIYVSMLASWPKSNPIFLNYYPHTRDLVGFQGTGMARRQFVQLALYTTTRRVESIAFSPDSAFMAWGSSDGSVYLWDVRGGQMILGPLTRHTSSIKSVAFSPDGLRITSGSEDGTICIWNAQNGEIIQDPVNTDGWDRSAAFSPDSLRVVSSSTDYTVSVWDVRTGDRVLGPLEGHTGRVNSVAFSFDGKRIASGSSDKMIRIWEASNGRICLGPLHTHSDTMSVAFSPTGLHLASGSTDCSVCVWDMKTGQMTLGPLKKHTGLVFAIAFSPDGGRIVSGSADNTICIWDAESGEAILGPLKSHIDLVILVAFSPDGTRIASCSNDKSLCIWDAQSKQEKLESYMGHTDSISSVVVSPDGSYIASGSDDMNICVWDGEGEQMALKSFREHERAILSVSFSPDGSQVASGYDDGTVCSWDVQSGELVPQSLEAGEDTALAITFSFDGTRVAWGSSTGPIFIWGVESGDLEMTLGSDDEPSEPVFSLAFSPDDTRLASGSADGSVCLWDTHTGEEALPLLQAHTDSVTSVAYSRKGDLIASGSRDSSLCLWNARSGQLKHKPLIVHRDGIEALAFSRDDTLLASGSNDKTVIIWDVQTGEMLLGPLTGHSSQVTSVDFFPDGTRVVSGSVDQTLRVWLIQEAQSSTSGDMTFSANHHTPFNSSKPAHSKSSSWVLDEHGWVLDPNGRLLVWVPSDLRRCLLLPRNTSLMSRHGSVKLSFEGAKIGESWVDSYSPV